ncbi:hypothetical protein D8674_027359 [Pyrus ussuriensis x Pyrus communis]|uniref:Uncharacterized protein n=1 Tax=Pyrus ussuriensis x Pyrus communis TaxID=2448454 RepID=A0A5N5I9I2_9ROSA|nr:hypothetical protein D8674_027359 [Pyrus ussuriensis x Pyrus communis]
MASACVNNIGVSPEKFPPATFPSYGWLSPRISFSHEFPNEDNASKLGAGAKASSPAKNQPDGPDPEVSCPEFEFRLEDPVAMLPADELFSGGKLMPLQFSSVKATVNDPTSTEIRSPDTPKYRRRTEIIGADPYLFSPKAPRCTSRWRELLGLKKLYQSSTATTTNGNSKSESHKTAATVSTSAPKSLKHFLHRSSKSLSSSPSASDASLSLPLLRDLDYESVSISSRLSLSSSSSGHEHEDLPRLSLDSDKPNPNPTISIHRTNPRQARVRTVKPREATKQRSAADQARVGRSPMRRATEESGTVSSRGVSVDSPRMNSSGKIIFQSLERSSSSPSSFNGGPRLKHRGMERSYSANVRVTPVLNVPVCSLRGSSKSGSVFGFGQLFSGSVPQKKEGNGTVSAHNRGQHGHYGHHSQSKNRTDRTA